MSEIFQKRTYELGEFIPLTQGEPGYEDPATIWIPIDRVTWPQAKKMSLVQFVSNLHKEQGPISLTGANVVVVYNTEFASNNYWIDVKVTRTSGGYIEELSVKDFVKTVSGFTLTIEDYTPGCSLNFLAFE